MIKWANSLWLKPSYHVLPNTHGDKWRIHTSYFLLYYHVKHWQRIWVFSRWFRDWYLFRMLHDSIGYIYIYIIRLITYNHIMSELFHFYHEKCRGIRMIQLPIGLKDLQNCMLCAGIVYRIRVNCIRTIELRIIKQMKTIVKFEVVWPAVSTFLSRELQYSCFFYFH